MVKSYPNPKSIVIFIICLGLLFTFITLFVWSGHLFGTLSVDDNHYYGEGSYTKDNVTYNFTYWMGMVISSIDGFYVNTDIQLTISEAFINYYGKTIPKSENITVVLQFDPPTRYDGEFHRQTDYIQTEFDGSNRYVFRSYSLIVNYPVSESKRITPAIFANGTLVAGRLEEAIFLDVQPAHMKTELNLAKVVVILTFWIVFFSIVTVVFQSLNYAIKYDGKNKNNSKSKRKEKLIRGEKLILGNSFRNMAEGEIKVFAKWWKKYLYAGFLLIIGGVAGSIIFSDISFGIILVPLGIGVFSIGLGFLSVTIADKSDKKMKGIALSVYKEIEGIFEDRRLSIMKARRIIEVKKRKDMDTEVDEFALHQDIIFGIWKCLTYLRRAKALIKWIDEPEQKGIIKLLEHFYKELKRDIIRFGIVIPDEYCGHLEQMHGIISEFKPYPKTYDKKHVPVAKQLLEQVLATNEELKEKLKKKK